MSSAISLFLRGSLKAEGESPGVPCLSAVRAQQPSPPPLPSFAPAYRATFKSDVLFFDNKPLVTSTDGTIAQSAELQARKTSGVEMGLDSTNLALYRQNVTYEWFTWWGLCSKFNLSKDSIYFDPLSGIANTKFAGLVRLEDGRAAQLWSVPSGGAFVWSFYVSNDARQAPLRVLVNNSGEGWDLVLTSYNASVHADDFKPAFSCSLWREDKQAPAIVDANAAAARPLAGGAQNQMKQTLLARLAHQQLLAQTKLGLGSR